jgi:site-specific DNA recombinase
MVTAVETRTAREYLRVSKGKGRTARSITDQHTENLAAEGEFGPWTWGKPYADTGSASKYRTKARDDFEKLMTDLASGAFGETGTVLVLWEISRLSRETGKGVAIIDLCEAGGYRIHVTSLDRTFDPSNYGDRHNLISGINDAEKEARLLSKRVLKGTDSALADGRPHGKLLFGYARDYELIDGRPRPVRQYPDPVEAPLVRELFERVAGWNGRKRESIRSVALDWERRGVVARQSGKPIAAQNLRPLLIRKAYLGIRVHGESERPGNWEPLIGRELFDAVQRLLADPTRKTHTTNAVQHVLTGTLKCDVCGNGMTISTGDRPKRTGGHRGQAAYVCRKYGCLRIDQARTDDYLINDLLAFLYLAPEDEVPEALADRDDDASELSAVRVQLASVRSQLREFEGEDPETPAEARLIGRKIEKLEGEIKELERRAAALAAPDPLTDVFETGPGAADRWNAADITVRRAVASIVFAPDGPLGQPRVRRLADSKSESVMDRIVWVRTTS